MKALRIFGNIIIGIILFALVFTSIFVRETNKIVSSKVFKETITNFVDDVKNGDSKLTRDNEELIDNMFKDEDAKEVITLIFNNYKKYRNEDDYSISSEDIKTLYNFLYKYRDHIKDSKIEYMDDIEFKEYFNDDKIREMTNDTFKNLDKLFDSKIIDIVINSYTLATSYLVRFALLFVILFFIILLCIINWSLIKWMPIFGGSLIASGIIFNIVFSAGEIIKNVLLNDNISININLSSFLLASIVQVVLGIILIILYFVLKNKLKEKDSSNLV